MSNLSDVKLNKLNSLSTQGGFWYITKQNLVFRDLCFMAKILDDWNDSQVENFASFFDSHKCLPEYGELAALTPHRATKNCEYLGLTVPSERYSAQNLTPFYFALKDLCKGNFNRLSLYPDIINKQLERIFIDSSLNALYTSQIKICPFMFLFKILLLIGDVTNLFKISIQEFKIFVATAQNWNDYFEVVESILRYRNDVNYKNHCDANLPKVADERYHILTQNHSQLEVTGTEISIKEGNVKSIRRKVSEYELNDALQSAEDIFSANLILKNNHLQQIYYGAPGTGKSHEINELTKDQKVIRTTFHPDSDYSTFVGCYKPIMENGKVYGAQGPLREGNKDIEEPKIAYRFVKQAFLKAYFGAWRLYSDANGENAKPQYLIIEEINRGNCAQIFGDLFQLLDRGDNGFSEYPIEADTDLQKEIQKAFSEEDAYKLPATELNVEGAVKNYTSNYEASLSEDIKEGRVLLLPPNLYIWATMNTSDQSLFPIDSAFKRRWDWKYVRIDKGYDQKNNKEFDWIIKVDDDHKYDWWKFLQAINDNIGSITKSEDKKLGYFFCKAKNGVIDVETFVNKVLFYLWNDVYKDYDYSPEFFREEVVVNGNKEKRLIEFSEYYKQEDNKTIPDNGRIQSFIEKVLSTNKKKSKDEINNDDESAKGEENVKEEVTE